MLRSRVTRLVLSAALLSTAACSQASASATDLESSDSGSASSSDDASAASDPGAGEPSDSAAPVGTGTSGTSGVAHTGVNDGGSLGGWQPGAADGGARASTDSGGAPAGPVVSSLTATIGPIAVKANQETTVCITMRLPNTAAAFVPHMTAQLAPGSHHLIVYRSKATTENLTPTVCTGFQDATSGNAAPLMISQKLSDELTFPSGIGVKIAAGQMIELEAHYLNASAATIQGQGTVTFSTIPVTTADVVESDLAFWGTENIFLTPGAHSVGPLFAAGIAGTHGFALTTHQHRLGKEFRVWFATSAADTNHAPVADTTDWSDPPLYPLSPQLDFDGKNGLAYQCDWNNTTGQIITYGESALQEMCFLWMYYYPTHGFDERFQ